MVRGDVDVEVRISQRALDRLVANGGLVNDYMEDVAREGWGYARQFSPIGSGDLFHGLDWEVETNSRDQCTARVGTRGVPYAVHFLMGHGPQPPHPNRPIGYTMVGRGIPFGNVNRAPGKRYPGVPAMFTSGPVRGFGGNDILTRGMNLALGRRGLGGLSVRSVVL